MPSRVHPACALRAEHDLRRSAISVGYGGMGRAANSIFGGRGTPDEPVPGFQTGAGAINRAAVTPDRLTMELRTGVLWGGFYGKWNFGNLGGSQNGDSFSRPSIGCASPGYLPTSLARIAILRRLGETPDRTVGGLGPARSAPAGWPSSGDESPEPRVFGMASPQVKLRYDFDTISIRIATVSGA